MPILNRSSLLKMYGVDLPIGKYSIHDTGDDYAIFTVQDDTEGCPLLGEIRTADGVRKCKDVVTRLTAEIVAAEGRGIEVWIEVK